MADQQASRDHDLRLALADLLKKKMLQSVRRGVGQQKAEDAVNQEVQAFMSQPGKVEVQDLVALEGRIHRNLDGIGVAKRTPLRVDEWATLFKFQSEVAELAEKRRKEELARKSEVLRGNLAVQVQAKERLKQVEKDAVKTLAREQEEDLRKFKAEATARQALDRQRTAQLRVDRSAQLAEKAARAAEEEKQRKREEDEFKRAMLREHVATIRAEEAARAKQKLMAEEFTRGNEEQVRLKAERKAGEERDALRMMHEFNERLRVQEEERFAALEAMKAKQRRQEELGTAVGPYKRYIDDTIIQRNFDKREADLAAREDAAKADIQLKREKLRAGLDQQLEEKNRLKAEEKARDRRMDDMLLEGARIADVYALEKQREVQEKMHDTMRSIKEQIAIAEAAKKVVMMSDTEKQINFEVLEMIPNSRIPLPLKGIVTSRYTEKMLAEETMRRKAAGTTKPVRNQ